MHDMHNMRSLLSKHETAAKKGFGLVISLVLIQLAIYGGLIAFGIWVVVKILQHYGIV